MLTTKFTHSLFCLQTTTALTFFLIEKAIFIYLIGRFSWEIRCWPCTWIYFLFAFENKRHIYIYFLLQINGSDFVRSKQKYVTGYGARMSVIQSYPLRCRWYILIPCFVPPCQSKQYFTFMGVAFDIAP